MNKYQEALYSIKRKKNFDPEYGEYTFNIFGDDDEDIEAIEELVNKTIPIKPTMLPYKGFDGEVASYQGCPNCTIPITNVFTSREYKPKFCQECGREFDWSKDE